MSLIIKYESRQLEVETFDKENELTIRVADEPIWLNVEQTKQLVTYLTEQLQAQEVDK